MTLVGFVLFGVILFVMWLMLRSCKANKTQEEAKATKRVSKFSPYTNVANESAETEAVDLEL